jgi:site-specific DNA-cytosine methylase
MNVLSLFDGISCSLVALKRNQISVAKYYASEIDKYAIQVSKANHPEIEHVGDVKNIGVIPNLDLLIGGSPCQDLSIAKKGRKGLEGERSGLFWEYVRILKESKPKYFVLENVNSMPREAKEIITKELGVEPIMINASLVSAQSRKRLFWTNIPVNGLPEDRGILFTDGKIGREIGRHLNAEGKREDKPHIPITRRIETINDGKCGTLTSVTKDNLVIGEGIVRKLTPIECERLQGLPDDYTKGICNTQRYKCLGNAFNVDVICFILGNLLKKAVS